MSIQIPSEWGMATPSKNHSMTATAQTLVDRVQRAKSLSQKVIALEYYCRAYARRCLAQSTKEASDEQVRNNVSSFVESVTQHIGLPKEIGASILKQTAH